MTRNEFMRICGEFLIDPSIALENENVEDAVRNDDEEKLREILESEF